MQDLKVRENNNIIETTTDQVNKCIQGNIDGYKQPIKEWINRMNA